MQAVYSLPTVHEDLRETDVLKEVFFQLRQLDIVVSDVLSRIQNKVDEQKQRMITIDEVGRCVSSIFTSIITHPTRGACDV